VKKFVMKIAHRLGGVALAAALCSMSLGAFMACSTPIVPPAKEPEACKLQVVNMTILSSGLINPSVLGEARPVQLRIYQLATDVRFQNADFEDIWKRDKATLQDDLIKVEEMSVYPNYRIDVQFERDEKAMVVAAVALFRNPTGRTWGVTFDLPPPPGKGNCATPQCADGKCGDGGASPPNLLPRYAVWIDGTKVDEGDDHLEDEIPNVVTKRVRLPFSGPMPAPPPAPEAPAPEPPAPPAVKAPALPTPKVGP
jgi:type VI secretion system protein VasD